MNCPTDGETLLLSERQGVEIDYCPRCRGVWLDRGELDKLLAVVQRDDDDRRKGRERDDDDDDDRFRDRDRDDHYRDDRYRDSSEGRSFDPRRKKKKKSSFLSEMFEFGGD